MKKKKLFCLIFFCFVVIPVFCKNQFTVNKSFSIQQVEPKEKDIEVRTQKFLFSIKKDSMIKHEIIDNNDFVSTFQIKISQTIWYSRNTIFSQIRHKTLS